MQRITKGFLRGLQFLFITYDDESDGPGSTARWQDNLSTFEFKDWTNPHAASQTFPS